MGRANVRKIIRIDEELCNGCGDCVGLCTEGAIAVVAGKARVLRKELCDGAGACLASCPTGALSIETGQAAPFQDAVHDAKAPLGLERSKEATCFMCSSADTQIPLVFIRINGTDTWCCTRCLPKLIHG